MPAKCSFYKWLPDYQKVLNGMVQVGNLQSSSGAFACFDEPFERKVQGKYGDKYVDDGKVDKVIRLVECLVVIGVVLCVLVFLCVLAVIVK